MIEMVSWLVLSLVSLALLYSVLAVVGAWRWSLETRRLFAQLDAAKATFGAARYDAGEIADLPAPVRRFFALALTDGQPIIRSGNMDMTGRFNMSLDAAQWKPFTSKQRVVTDRPGFVWNGRINLIPGVPVRVHDAYVAGKGLLEPAILGLFPLGSVKGGGEIARGELMRWFAEAVWYPTALLPSQGVVWQAVDDTSARATITDGPIRLDMLFRFGTDGLVSGILVAARGGLVDGKTVMMPWEGTFGDYRRQDGMMVPFYGEVAWITPRGRRPYFMGTATRLAYGFAP